jgi:hypothetical protein
VTPVSEAFLAALSAPVDVWMETPDDAEPYENVYPVECIAATGGEEGDE